MCDSQYSFLALILFGLLSGCADDTLGNQEASGPTAGNSGTEAADQSCLTAVSDAEQSNSFDLFEASNACLIAQRLDESAYLLTLGQIRSSADMLVLQPATDADELRMLQLYGAVFYQYGGYVADVLSDPDRNSELVSLTLDAELSYTVDYDPGWEVVEGAPIDLYDRVVNEQRKHRLWQLGNAALQLQDDAYFAAFQAMQRFSAENPTIIVGTEIETRHNELNAALSAAAEGIPQIPEPQLDMPSERLMAPHPNATHTELFIGFNGPQVRTHELFQSEEDVVSSWLSLALSGTEMGELLSAIDFDTEVAAVFGSGLRRGASGEVSVREFRYRDGLGYSLSVNIGIVPSKCGEDSLPAYPFVVVKGPAGPPDAELSSFSVSNFPDDCGGTITGESVLPIGSTFGEDDREE